MFPREPPHYARLRRHLEALSSCARCPGMEGPPVVGRPLTRAPVLLVGQAPGARELIALRPFAHTAGRTLFQWLGDALELDEDALRDRLWFSAVCRCFPGKALRAPRSGEGEKKPRGGDRVPAPDEIAACAPWLDAELRLFQPHLVLAVGKLAISRFLEVERLEDVVGQQLAGERAGVRFDLLPLPHPSGVSTWHRREPGRALLTRALALLAAHPAAAMIRAEPQGGSRFAEEASSGKTGQPHPSLLRSPRDAKA